MYSSFFPQVYFLPPRPFRQPTSQQLYLGKTRWQRLFLLCSFPGAFRGVSQATPRPAAPNGTNPIVQNLFLTGAIFPWVCLSEFPGKTQSIPISPSAPPLSPLPRHFLVANQLRTLWERLTNTE